MRCLLNLLVLCAVLVFSVSAAERKPDRVFQLWPGAAPGDTEPAGEEKDTSKPSDRMVAGKPVIRLGNVWSPTLSVYRAPKEKATGMTVMVCPGGGYHILALDLEGTEVCEWLNSIGVNAALLKYRVPKREGRERYAVAWQDGQRAMGLLRHNAKDLGLDPKRMGVLGFSAGAHLAALLSNDSGQRTYPVLDTADSLSCRPDFALLIYPGYLTVKEENDKIAPELKISSNTPPTFLAMTQDDTVRVESALFYAVALRQAKVPFELHVYPSGGHGYGLRPDKEHLVTTWPDRAADWLRSLK